MPHVYSNGTDADYMEIQRSARQLRDEEQRAGVFSLTWLGRNVTKVLLFAGLCFWLKAYSIYLAPITFTVACPPGSAPGAICWTPGSVTDGLLSMLLLFAGASASAVVAPMLLASVLPNNAMMLALDRLEYRYGWVGKLIAIGLAAFFVRQSYETMWLFWASKPMFTGDGGQLLESQINNWAICWTLLFTVVPAWALNRLTTGEWVLQLLGAREAARLHTMMDLEKEALNAIKARARAVLYADVARMTVEERQANAKEVAALLTGIERGVVQSLRRALSERDSRSHLAMAMFPNDQQIVDRHQQIADVLAGTMTDIDLRSTMIGAAVDVDDRAIDHPTVALPAAETVGFAVDSKGPQRTTADHHVSTMVDIPERFDSLSIAWRHFGTKPFKRADLQSFLRCEKSHAINLIAEWKQRNYLTEVEDTAWTYGFRREVGSWVTS